MKKAVITLIIVLVAAIVLVTGLLFTILLNPSLIINKTTMDMAARQLKVAGVEIKWDEASFSFESHGLLDKTMRFGFEGMCASLSPNVERACFSRAKLAFRIGVDRMVPTLKALGPVVVEGGEVHLRFEKDEEKKPPSGELPLPVIALPSFLSKTRFHDMNLDIVKLEIDAGNASISGSVHAALKAGEDNSIEGVELKTELREAKSKARIDLWASAKSKSGFRAGDWSLLTKGSAELGGSGSAKLDASFSSADGSRADGKATVVFAQGSTRAKGELKSSLSEDRIELSALGSLSGFSEEITSASVSNCRIELTRTDREKNRGFLSLNCSVKAGIKEFALPGELDPFYELPRSIAMNISGEAETFFMPDMDQKIEGRLNASMVPLKGKLVSTRGKVGASFSGVPSKPPDNWKVSTDFDVHFVIESFSRLERALASTPWPVPAPFNIMDGVIDFALTGSMSTSTGKARFPAKLSTRLESKEQRIFTESDGEFVFSFGGAGMKNASLDLEVKLEDVQLQLPNLALATLPQLSDDSRIELKAPEGPKKSGKDPAISWRLHVASPEGKPVRILSNITPDFVPIELDLNVDGDGSTGRVAINKFPVELFRRKAKVDSLDIELKKPADESTVKGSFTIDTGGYVISLLVAGLMESPAITLVSNPPLSEGDIISTLIYGEPADSLDEEGASSVGSMSAAIADRALALTSMFVLASTPIQSVGYNPQTKAFSARIKLGKKTSLITETGGTTKQVGIRQRIGKGWRITTSYGTDSDPSAITGGTALIEWTKRY